MIDRTKAPAAHPLQVSPLAKPQWTELSNHIPVCFVKAGSQEVIEIQLVLQAGYAYDFFPGGLAATARLLTEGTQHYSAKNLAEKLDFYGAFFQTDIGYEQSALTISTLSKHIHAATDLFAEIILRPTFPESELEQWRSRMLQRFAVEEKKTNYQASRMIKKKLLGINHPYAYTLDQEAVRTINAEILHQTWAEFMQPGMGYLMVAGNFDEKLVLECLEYHFGSLKLHAQNKKSNAENLSLAAEKGYFSHEMPETMQSTIRCGLPAVSYQHPERYKLAVLGTIFGGYFGSRLMKNIREDKGYTYGIFGDFMLMKNAGYLLIGTDVANEFVQSTLEEINKEMNLLRNEAVSKDELNIARNYMLGNLISRVETPFQIAEQIKSFRLYGLALEEWENQFEIIQQMTAEDVLLTAQKYFNPDELCIVVAGSKLGEK